MFYHELSWYIFGIRCHRDITGNPIGPNLTVDTFEGCENMIFL